MTLVAIRISHPGEVEADDFITVI